MDPFPVPAVEAPELIIGQAEKGRRLALVVSGALERGFQQAKLQVQHGHRWVDAWLESRGLTLSSQTNQEAA